MPMSRPHVDSGDNARCRCLRPPDAAALYEADAAAAAVDIATIATDDGSTTSLDGGAVVLMAMLTPLMWHADENAADGDDSYGGVNSLAASVQVPMQNNQTKHTQASPRI